MPAPITLTVTKGTLQGKQFRFDEPTICLVGRAPDCDVRFPSDIGHLNISRHHCLLTVEPPLVTVRDCGSRNGTFVNGTKIGQRSWFQHAEDALPDELGEYPLLPGDELRVGDVVLRVGGAAFEPGAADLSHEEADAEGAVCVA